MNTNGRVKIFKYKYIPALELGFKKHFRWVEVDKTTDLFVMSPSYFTSWVANLTQK
jgi:urease alpha subunit